MIKFEEFPHKYERKPKTKVESSIKTAFYVFVTISAVNAQITSTTSSSPVSKHLFGEDISSFCAHDKCTVVFPNGTSVSLSIGEFHNVMTEYMDNRGEVKNHLDLEDQRNSEQPIEKNEGAEFVFTEFDFDIDKTTLKIPHEINPSSGEIVEKTINSNLSNSTSPTNEMNATEHTSNIIRSDEIINASDDSNDPELARNVVNFKEETQISFGTEQKHEIRSRSVLSISIDDDTTNLSQSTNDSESECPAPDPERIPDGDPSDLTSGIGDSTGDSQRSTIKPSTAKDTPSQMDHDYSDQKESQQQKSEVKLSQEDIEKAKRMTKCLELKTANGMVCICNETYCDKFIQPDKTPEWIYTWYTSSKSGLRFRKKIDKLTRYTGDEEGAFYVNTNTRYQEIKGFGATFTDSACKLIQDLSRETKKNLLESYFGPFGINYRLGRVPIGGTDFSPRFYSYIDNFDESMKTFMLTEQDFKYKIPIILEAIELSYNEMKLIGTAWSSPIWMKIVPTPFGGNLQRKYFPQWAEYHKKFLDQYLHNGIKFWAITTGREPMNYYYIPNQPQRNVLEWTPYEQSYWVGSHLGPTLNNSAHRDVLILGFDENREFVTSYFKLFSEDYNTELIEEPYVFPDYDVMDSIAGISIQGYMDYKSNLPYLDRVRDNYPGTFFLYTETSCLGQGLPEFGGWTCAETYATKIIQALNNWVVGWMDYNLALDHLGGPTYIDDHSLHSPILVDVKRDEFFKEPLFYIMGHFSNFLLPGSYRVETVAPKGVEGIYAVAAILPHGGTVIVFYNQLQTSKRVTFIIDKKYKLSIEVPGKSINSVVFW